MATWNGWRIFEAVTVRLSVVRPRSCEQRGISIGDLVEVLCPHHLGCKRGVAKVVEIAPGGPPLPSGEMYADEIVSLETYDYRVPYYLARSGRISRLPDDEQSRDLRAEQAAWMRPP